MAVVFQQTLLLQINQLSAVLAAKSAEKKGPLTDKSILHSRWILSHCITGEVIQENLISHYQSVHMYCYRTGGGLAWKQNYKYPI